MRAKSRLTLVVDTILDFLIRWAIGGMLTYLFGRLAKRFNFEGKTHFDYYFWLAVGRIYMPAYIRMISDLKKSTEQLAQRPFRNILMSTLSIHREMHRHRVLDEKSCDYCQTITENSRLLQQLVTEPELYPPFNFSRSS